MITGIKEKQTKRKENKNITTYEPMAIFANLQQGHGYLV
jgi:hypothetical protein